MTAVTFPRCASGGTFAIRESRDGDVKHEPPAGCMNPLDNRETTVTAAAFAAVLLALLAAHHVGDHWVQTDHQATGKGARGAAGARHCAAHVVSYTLCTALAAGLAWWALDLHVTPAGFVAGQALSAVTHYWADRRFTLAWLCARLGKTGYYERGGAYQLDQSWHWLWLTVAAGAMVAL